MKDAVNSKGFSRRKLLIGGAATGAALAASATTAVAASSSRDQAAGTAAVPPFYGPHQAAVLDEPMPATVVASFDSIAAKPYELVDLMQTISSRAKMLTSGIPEAPSDPAAPPDDNGILGDTVPGGQLAVTVGIGSSLFDSRYGLEAHLPHGLTPMRTFPNDNLDPAQCHGDVSIQLSAASPDIVVHALRDVTKHTRGGMQPRWRVDGFASPPRPSGTPRNLFGFKDGISNPSVTDTATLNSLIWAASSQPKWTAGGTFQVVRIIRQLVEFWDRVSLAEQELMIGRRRSTGAPLDANDQNATPDFANDPLGQVIPLNAHMRLANPRTAKTADSRLLRRGWNYDLGFDVNGNLNQGLLFICYQQDLKRQFEAVQTRLIDEPMVDYISPVGGGYFFVLPGLATSSNYYGESLFQAAGLA